MGSLYDNELTNSSGYTFRLVITDEYLVDGESYFTDPLIKYKAVCGANKAAAESRFVNTNTWGSILSNPQVDGGGRTALYIETNTQDSCLFKVSSMGYKALIRDYREGAQIGSDYSPRIFHNGYAPTYPEFGHTDNFQRMAYCICEISTNIPIFSSNSDAQNYLNTGELSNAINYGGGAAFTVDTKDYYCYNRYEEVSIERGIITVIDSTIHQLNERIIYNGHDICLFRTASNPFALSLKMGSELVGSYFSNTQAIDNIPYDLFSDELEYESPFYSTYNRALEIYEYSGNIGIGLATNLPIWSNEQDADDFLAGLKDISECENWNKISGDKNYEDIIDNLTGEKETTTQFGEVFVRNIFSQMYLCDTTALYKMSNDLFDYDVTTLSGLWEDFKKGMEMYGSNPMDCVQGLRFYPFDLTTIFSNTSPQNYVYFGAYREELGSTIHKVIYANGYKDLGSVTIKRTFKDWRDFEPYTKLSIYLPYVGRYPLDLKKYYDKTVNVRYYLDIRTGVCCACLIANGVLLDWFDGIIGTEMPITLTDYSSYANNQLNIIMRNAGIGIAGEGTVGALGVKGVQGAMNAGADKVGTTFADTYVAGGGGDAAFSAASSAASGAKAAGWAGVAGTAAIGGAAMAVVGLGIAEKTAFDMMRTGTAAYTKGRPGSSAMINQFLPQYPTFMFEVQEIDESPYLNELYGRPSNASGVIGDFSGYLEAEDVMLICPIATDNERQEIIDLVRSGIYL